MSIRKGLSYISAHPAVFDNFFGQTSKRFVFLRLSEMIVSCLPWSTQEWSTRMRDETKVKKAVGRQRRLKALAQKPHKPPLS